MTQFLDHKQLVITPIVQVSVPKQDVIIKPRMGQQMLSGELTATSDRYMLDTALPDSTYRTVREDLSRFSPVPVTRAAFKMASNSYVGVIDSDDTPYLFALNSRGLRVRPATDPTLAWLMFDQYTEMERTAALSSRRMHAADEQERLDALLTTPLSKAEQRAKIKQPGLRGGKFYFDKHGVVRYGERHIPKSKHQSVPDHAVPVSIKKKHGLSSDDEALPFHAALHAAKVSSLKHARAVVSSTLDDVYDLQDSTPHTRAAAVHHVISYLHKTGVFAFGEKDDAASSSKPAVAQKKTYFKTRIGLAVPRLPTVPAAKGTQLLVNGKPVKLSPDAEFACLTWARRVIVNGDPRGPAWRKNFERSLHSLGVPKGTYDFKHFVKRVTSEEVVPQEKDTTEITPKTRPDLFVKQDDKLVRLDNPKFPTGGFYAPKKDGGAWVRPLLEEELIFNGSHGAAPKGFKGKVVYEPDARWVYSWTHPVADLYPKVKRSKFTGYVSTLSDNVQADMEKFTEATRFGKNIEKIRTFTLKGLTNSDPAVRAMAACNYLMDVEHIRVGEETYANDKLGKNATFGIASMRAKHIKIDGTSVIFDFPGKKGEEWYRVVDCAKRPELLAVFKQALKGKKPDDRVWEGSHGGKDWKVTSKEVNDYLKEVDPKFHAHQYRTFHANAYMHQKLSALSKAAKTLGLSSADVKKLYKGVNLKKPGTAKAMKKLLAQKIDGVSLQDYLGIPTPDVVDGKQIVGVLPAVASRLGHTVGACRGSYVDPLLVVPFGIEHGWDERTAKEKRGRSDLPTYTKPVKKSDAPWERPNPARRSRPLTAKQKARARARARAAGRRYPNLIDNMAVSKAWPLVIVLKGYRDRLHGGRADGKKPSDFDARKLREGAKHESEHTDDPAIAREIAMDHLSEDESYYRKLKRIEKSEGGHTPPPAVRAAARRGLELRKKHNRGGTMVGVARARDLAGGKSVSNSTIKRMNSYFARHAVDKKGKDWANLSRPSAGYIAWLLWGGDAGKSWAAGRARKLEKSGTSLTPEVS